LPQTVLALIELFLTPYVTTPCGARSTSNSRLGRGRDPADSARAGWGRGGVCTPHRPPPPARGALPLPALVGSGKGGGRRPGGVPAALDGARSLLAQGTLHHLPLPGRPQLLAGRAPQDESAAGRGG